MKTWQEDLLDLVTGEAATEHEVLSRIQAAARALGFEHVAYGFKAPLPLTKPRIVLLNDYPQAWRNRYLEAGYLQTDPTVAHGCVSRTPVVWSDALFANARPMWEEAQAVGLKVGWAQSSLDGLGVGGMLTLSRSGEPLSTIELEASQQKMCWLVHVAHMSLSRLLRAGLSDHPDARLSSRELEVLRWSADGKSAQDIADILTVSKDTVNFHVKNAVKKLRSGNKTAAVVRAAILGYLY